MESRRHYLNALIVSMIIYKLLHKKKKGKCQIENQHLGILNLQLSSIMSKTSTSLPLMSEGYYLKKRNGNGGKIEGCFVTFK